MRASILLEDGTHVQGIGHGAPGECVGEVVFNTAMTGYEEVVSDPSYRGQIVVFTTSHIGNTGITEDDLESGGFTPQAFICKDFSGVADNHRSRQGLEEYLRKSNRFAVSNVDTRFLTRRLRDSGCMMGIVSTVDHNPESLGKKLAAAGRIESNTGLWNATGGQCEISDKTKHARYKVAVLDFGIKKGILQKLQEHGCQCVFFAPPFRAQDIEAIQPDGLFLSNGAGDPRLLLANANFKHDLLTLTKRYPTFGICLGHQILGLLHGGRVEKLAFGHHAVNHPVKVVRDFCGKKVTPRAMITSQNHNYHVISDSVENEFHITHVHGNDGTVAGMHHRSLPVFSVQFHPEANPGPHDAALLFAEFQRKMEVFHARAH